MIRIIVIVVFLLSLIRHGHITSPVGWQLFFFPILSCTSILLPKIHPSFCITATAVSLPCCQVPFFISGKGRLFFLSSQGSVAVFGLSGYVKAPNIKKYYPGCQKPESGFVMTPLPTCPSPPGAGRTDNQFFFGGQLVLGCLSTELLLPARPVLPENPPLGDGSFPLPVAEASVCVTAL